jgi:hypothetical protein
MKLLLAILAMLSALPALAAPKAELWDRWAVSDESSTQTVDHTAWDRFLSSYVVAGRDGINRVRYGAVSAADRAALEGYVAMVSGLRPTALRRAEQLAFWVNLYNAATVREVLAHFPVASIRDIRSGLFSPGPWGKELVSVEGVGLTLDDIEHRILRPGWRDARLHYALNCASLGCPNLWPRAFTPATNDTILDRAARDYVNHPRGVTITGASATVSSIYDWYRADFGGDNQGVLTHLRLYAEPGLSAALQGVTELDFSYDWTLNDAK